MLSKLFQSFRPPAPPTVPDPDAELALGPGVGRMRVVARHRAVNHLVVESDHEQAVTAGEKELHRLEHLHHLLRQAAVQIVDEDHQPPGLLALAP